MWISQGDNRKYLMVSVNRTKRSIANIGFSIVNRIVAMLLPFAVRTVIIYTIGIVYLGLDSLFTSVLSVLSLSELGFSSAVIFSMYRPIAEGNDEKVKALLCFYKKIYRIVGSVILVAGIAILPLLHYFIADGTDIPSNINIYIVYIVFLVNTSISYFLFAYKSSILVASMRNDIDSLFDTVRSIVSHCLQIVILFLFKQYYLYILILPIITILNDVIRNIYINKKYPQYRGKSNLEKSEKKDIMTKVGALIGNKIGGVVFTSADSIVISSFLGLITLAQFTNYFTIYTAVFGLISTIYNSIQSVVGNSLVVNSKERNLKIFRVFFLINAVITMLCTCLFITLYQPFIERWVGATNVLPLEIPFLLAIYFFVRNSRRILVLFKEAAGMWKEDFLKPYISVVLNIGLNIFLVKTIGLPGVVISSIAAIAIVEIPWETHVFFKKYFGFKPTRYYLFLLLTSAVTIYAAFLCYTKCDAIGTGILGIILKAIFTTAICMIISLPFVLFTKEGQSIVAKIGSHLKRH